MAEQLKLPFEEVPISCPVQQRYHAIAPVLAEKITPENQAKILSLSYSTVIGSESLEKKEWQGFLIAKPNVNLILQKE